MATGQVIIGVIAIIIGAALTLTLVGAIYGIPLIVVGILLIVFRKAESKVEQRKDLNKSTNKK